MPSKEGKPTSAASTRRRTNDDASGSDSSQFKSSSRVNKRTDSDRKRTQNRIAQKCLRERRAASDRHIANMLEAMQFATETDQAKQYSKLLDTQVKLVKDNQEMEDALFRMRKKLLSLSNAAANAAEDPVFDMIFGRQAPREDSTGDEQRQEVVEEDSAEINQPIVPDMELEAAAPAIDTTSPETPGAVASVQLDASTDTLDTIHVMFDNYMLPRAESDPQLSQAGSIECSFTFDESDLLQTGAFLQPLEESSSQCNMFGDATSAPPQNLHAMLQVSPWDMYSFAPTQKLTVYSGVEFSRKILQAASICVSRIRQMALARYLSTDLITKQVAVATVNMLGTNSGLHQYLYDVNGAACMERTVYWRLTGARRSLVPEPFRPTPLQCSSLATSIGPVIDFVNWPEIRDQLILAGGNVDMDAFSRDIVLNTVIEVPGRKLAVNVFGQHRHQRGRQEDDMQNTSLGSNSNCSPVSTSTSGIKIPTSALDEGWVYFEIDRTDSDFQSWAADPVEEALSRRLWRKVQQLTKGIDPNLFLQNENWLEDAPRNTPLESALRRINPKLCAETTRLGRLLGDTPSWKLNKELANKYPVLDFSSIAETGDDMLPSYSPGFIGQYRPESDVKDMNCNREAKSPTTSNRYSACVLSLKGITCGACIAQIEATVNEIPGVTSCRVSLALSRAIIEYNGDLVQPLAMVSSIQGTGYDAWEQPPSQGHRNLQETLKTLEESEAAWNQTNKQLRSNFGITRSLSATIFAVSVAGTYARRPI
ncbi:heavy metal translocating p-type ATPase [Fusarium tjaetaba]|uniref:Heavy metal translocating p-type ATPase n=1 Tax=Fusarium tjaetaba TaxID=1567544 RepID=A0A8H5VIZ6_9HYPO|nr:heavy metal translocating p-type ATPase [Fusarium tjaetaba]KAF5625186.1 heavy metal translocating p-type ATPase [Fusarium tjaetaba]